MNDVHTKYIEGSKKLEYSCVGTYVNFDLEFLIQGTLTAFNPQSFITLYEKYIGTTLQHTAVSYLEKIPVQQNILERSIRTTAQYFPKLEKILGSSEQIREKTTTPNGCPNTIITAHLFQGEGTSLLLRQLGENIRYTLIYRGSNPPSEAQILQIL
jgi:hypothetical protein